MFLNVVKDVKNTNVVKSVKKMNKFLSGKGLYIHDIRLLILLTFLTNVKKYFEIPTVERFLFFEICLSHFYSIFFQKQT